MLVPDSEQSVLGNIINLRLYKTDENLKGSQGEKFLLHKNTMESCAQYDNPHFLRHVRNVYRLCQIHKSDLVNAICSVG